MQFLVGDVPPPLKFQGGRQLWEKNKEKERKIAKFSTGSKQMGPNRWVFEGVTPLNPKVFVPVPLEIFAATDRI